MNDLFTLSGEEIKKKIADKEISCFDLTTQFLEQIEKVNPELNALLYIDAYDALEYSKKVDEMVEKKDFSKPLLGIPIVVHDSIDMVRTPSTYGSLILKKNIPEQDAIEIEQLKEAGTIILGKTNMSEFGLGYETVNKLCDPCRNPLNSDYSPGGGLGGTAAAVAAGLAPAGVAGDFNGSLRMSSSFCGLYGLMPTRGRVPIIRKHMLSYSEQQFYRKGVIARRPEDIADLLQVMAQPDERDLISHLIPPEDYREAMTKPAKKLKIAWCPEFDPIATDPVVLKICEEQIEKYQKAGHQVFKIDLKIKQDLYHHFSQIFSADRFITIMRLFEETPDHKKTLSQETIKWLRIGDQVTGVQYSLAINFMQSLKHQINGVLEEYDYILTPTMPCTPFKIGHPPKEWGCQNLPIPIGLWGYLIPFNMSGHPAITFPCGKTEEGLPVGMQAVGPYFSEGNLLQFISIGK